MGTGRHTEVRWSGRTSTRVAGLVLTSAIVGLLSLARLPSSAAAERLLVAGSGSALVAQVVTDQQPSATAPIDRPGVAVLASSSSSYDALGAIGAQAALYDPGATVQNGPTLLCEQFFPCPASPPSYPLAVAASYPTKPRADTAGTGTLGGSGAPLRVQPTAAHAQAASDGASGQAQLATLGVLPQADLLAIGSARSRSSAALAGADGTALVVAADSELSDIDIAGVLQVASLQVRSEVTLSATGKAVRDARIVLQGATVQGQQVVIDQDGVQLAGRTGPGSQAANQALARVLGDRGVTVRLVAAPVRPADPGYAAAYGLLVTFTQTLTSAPEPPAVPVPGLPAPPSLNRTYTGTVLLGAASATASRVTRQTFPLPAAQSPSPVAVPVSGGAPAAIAPGDTAEQGAVPPVPLTSDGASEPAAAPAGTPAPQAGALPPAQYRLAGLTAAELRLVYLVLAASAGAVLLSGRLVGPRRRRVRLRGPAG